MTTQVKPFLAVATASIAVKFSDFAQALPQMVPTTLLPEGWVQATKELTLTGALIIAVYVMWKSLQAKDQQLLESAKAVTTALTASAASNSELRKIIQDSIEAKTSLTDSIGALQKSVEKLDYQNTVQMTTRK